MRKYLFLLLLSALLPWFGAGVQAQIKGNEVTVVVSPNHLNWKYKLKEKCEFRIQVFKAQNLLPGATIDYELGPEMYPTEKKEGVVLKDGSLTLSGTLAQPGFLRCKVKAHVDGYTYEGLATAGYEPEKLQPVTTMPDDFEAFWKGQLEWARQTPLNATWELLPDRCTENVEVYQVSFQTMGWGGRFYGILTQPRKAGKYPALLRVPGAGVRPYTGDISTAERGAIVLEVGIHGIPVTQPQKVYDDLAAGGLQNYWNTGRESRDESYYRRVVVGALRAVDFICSLPNYNGKALGVTGSSQGGFLSFVTAALDSRVTFLAAVHPALCDHAAHLKGRAGGWPHWFYYFKNNSENAINTSRYFDTANFARLIKVPGWYSWGYNDEVCPPTSMYAAYNTLTAPKELHPYLQTGHYWYQEQWDAWQKWIFEKMGI